MRVFPQPGWSGWLEATITHAVSADGLTVTVSATNIGDGDVPFGYAAHPYLTVGEETVDEVDLTVPAAAYLEVDPDRLLPIRVAPVDGTDLDLRDGPTLGLAQPGQRDDRPDPRRGRPLAGHPRSRRPDRRAVGRRDHVVGADLHRRAVPRLVASRWSR